MQAAWFPDAAAAWSTHTTLLYGAIMSDLNAVDIQWAWQPFEPTAERPWDRRLAAHLYRRAGFGADQQVLAATVAQTPGEAVDGLLADNQEPTAFRSVADGLAETLLAGGDASQLPAAWVYRLMFTPNQLLEKMTLFWHGHFATSADKVQAADLIWQQNSLLREQALGDFGSLTQAIAQDPAMLIYLDSAMNRKAHPNENFARELMELFCLGEGHYSERDVQELARCFTGWEIKNNRFRKNRYQQDRGEKSVLGQTGAFDGEDGIRVVLEQPSLELFLARKWFRYFIADEPQPSDELLRPLAEAFRRSELQIADALRMLLRSNLFFSEYAVGRKIKSPVELIVGFLRSLRATTNAELVAQGLHRVGQGLFAPPNVKGWDGGRHWINSSTLLGRSNLVADILSHEATRFDGQTLSDYLSSIGVREPDEALEHFESCLLPMDLSTKLRQTLREKMLAAGEDRERALRSLLHALVSLPQCQLG